MGILWHLTPGLWVGNHHQELECADRAGELIHATPQDPSDPSQQGWPHAKITYTLLRALMLLRHGATSENGELCTVRPCSNARHSGSNLSNRTPAGCIAA
jgi:hypothetical protein